MTIHMDTIQRRLKVHAPIETGMQVLLAAGNVIEIMLSRINALHLRSAIMAMACAFQLNTATPHNRNLIDTTPKHHHPVQPLEGHASDSFVRVLAPKEPPATYQAVPCRCLVVRGGVIMADYAPRRNCARREHILVV